MILGRLFGLGTLSWTGSHDLRGKDGYFDEF